MGREDLHESKYTPGWMVYRKCNDTDPKFFYPEGSNGAVQRARRFCNGSEQHGEVLCPVRDECLEYAMENGEKFGVWGGTSERERRRLRKTWHLRPTPVEVQLKSA